MIDSLNIVLKYIDKLDVKYITERLGIEKYSKFKDEDGKKGFAFLYKTIEFKYYLFGNLLAMTTTHKILDKKDITLSDKDGYKNQTMKIIKEVIEDKKYEEVLLSQIDYCADINTGGKDYIKEYYKLINKYPSEYKRKRRKKRYETSIQLTSDGGKILKAYGKVACINDNAIKGRRSINSKYADPEIRKLRLQEFNKQVERDLSLYDEGILRLEIAIRKPNLIYYFKVSEKKRKDAEKAGMSEDEVNKIPIEYRTIENYWNEEKMNKLFLNEIKQYFYTGNYYKLSKAVHIIKNTKKYKNNMKNKLILFLCRIKCVGIDKVKKRGLYCKGTILNHLERLSSLNINPITIDEESEYDMLESIYSLALKKCERDYFK